ncbi:hypothetical protein J5N97_015956 [Dioscorea zingiberensis]|uniref:Uncharacterized protein n=1 Tax=Dioscorea zingiberensis TaxID=325984 RepID=A0A9D5CIR5_9LILI|nr:hypothetical protein J5N97_015956 [Dioscorea zingiberensis]
MATSISAPNGVSTSMPDLRNAVPHKFFVWREFVWGAIAGAFGEGMMHPIDTLKTRIQSQSVISGSQSQKNMIQMLRTVSATDGLRGKYWSTLARDVPFAGLMVTFYEALKDLTDFGKQKLLPSRSDLHVSNSFEGLILGGLAGGLSAYLTTPFDVIKTRLQVQGSIIRYNGWSDALRRTWMTEGLNGLFKGSIPRVIWYIPASALTFMAVEFLREHFNEKTDDDVHEITSLSLDTSSKIQEAV